MANVFRPEALALEHLGFGSVAHVPVLFDSQGRYAREMNRYMRERALLNWHPKREINIVLSGLRYPRRQSLVNLANHLKNFLEWCECAGEDWKTLPYDKVLQYQQAMLHGLWSSDGSPLEPETANQRADAATHFLQWAAERSLRPAFEFPLSYSHRLIRTGTSVGTQQKRTYSRAGRARETSSKAIRAVQLIPNADELRRWFEVLVLRRGYAKCLAARFMVATGVRRAEIVALQINQLLCRSELTDLAKRGRFTAPMNVTGKGGKTRIVEIPLELIFEVRTWADTKRLTLVHRYHKRTRQPAPIALFLGDKPGYEGIPISSSTIYELFKVHPPVPKWSPHRARHTFACLYVLNAIEHEARAAGASLSTVSATWLSERGAWWLKLLQDQMGHVSESTTDLYLRWIMTTAKVAEVSLGWHRFLDE